MSPESVLCAYCGQQVETTLGSTGVAQQLYKKPHGLADGRLCSGSNTPAYGRPPQ